MAHNAPHITNPENVVDVLKKALGNSCLGVIEAHDEITFVVKRDDIVGVLTKLRDEHEYQQMVEMAGVDYPSRVERFEICYHLLSLTKNHRVRVKLSTDEDIPVPTITSIWPNADWLEREIFDMYGVIFSGHPDLRRILTDYGFNGHPFRKDFPLTGYSEMRYSEEAKRVVYEPVKLAQDFRSFDFMSPWEGAEYVLPGDEKAPAAPPPPPPAPTAKPVQERPVAKKAAEKKSVAKKAEGKKTTAKKTVGKKAEPKKVAPKKAASKKAAPKKGGAK
ncbi:NADH dehydrogenase [Sphingorhabdus lutea]|uniref:NADH-quinone oxidoreductase subunit C n=1 Tax=Sphingorhabdus lutea TaxID=1913578 RepID=A0A1L3JBT7_9SPHN|nr:NADH-quinone oxidoreductase subunit C [Sphingorhabdus lutea]APG62588.1 NADH dehydrogenase [Sphingorhabdus lutea]